MPSSRSFTGGPPGRQRGVAEYYPTTVNHDATAVPIPPGTTTLGTILENGTKIRDQCFDRAVQYDHDHETGDWAQSIARMDSKCPRFLLTTDLFYKDLVDRAGYSNLFHDYQEIGKQCTDHYTNIDNLSGGAVFPCEMAVPQGMAISCDSWVSSH